MLLFLVGLAHRRPCYTPTSLNIPPQAIPVSPSTDSRCPPSLPLPRPPFASLPGTVLHTDVLFDLRYFLAFYSLFTVTRCVSIIFINPEFFSSTHITYMYPWTYCALAHCSFYLYRHLFIYDHDTHIMSLMTLMTAVVTARNSLSRVLMETLANSVLTHSSLYAYVYVCR